MKAREVGRNDLPLPYGRVTKLLNLQCANHVINYDFPDIIADRIQRHGRARRVGSKYKNVFIYDLITRGTIDEDKIQKLDDEEKLLETVTGNSKERSEAIKQSMK